MRRLKILTGAVFLIALMSAARDERTAESAESAEPDARFPEFVRSRPPREFDWEDGRGRRPALAPARS